MPGSKIPTSRLPRRVDAKKVETRPAQKVLIVYNPQSGSDGMAIMEFPRLGEAMIARQKYHGRVVDALMPWTR